MYGASATYTSDVPGKFARGVRMEVVTSKVARKNLGPSEEAIAKMCGGVSEREHEIIDGAAAAASR